MVLCRLEQAHPPGTPKEVDQCMVERRQSTSGCPSLASPCLRSWVLAVMTAGPRAASGHRGLSSSRHTGAKRALGCPKCHPVLSETKHLGNLCLLLLF